MDALRERCVEEESHGREGEGSRPCMSSLQSLDVDQVIGILHYLPVPSVLAFGRTCRRFRELADSDSLWSYICKREWGSRLVDAWPAGNRKDLGWKQLYRQILALGSVRWFRLRTSGISPSRRASHSMNMAGDRIVVFGGGCDGGRHLDDTWATSLPEDATGSIVWKQVSIGAPTGRFGQSCTVVDDILVLFGGINDRGIRLSDTWISRCLDSGNLEENVSWQLLEVVAAPPSRGAHAGCYAGSSRVIIYGGIGSDGVRLKDTWMLDLSEGPPAVWHEITTLHSPPARSGHTLTWVGEKRMVLFGGRGTKFEVLNDVWLLNMEDDLPDWTELCACELHPAQPAPRAGHSASLIFGGRVVIFGGEDAGRSRKSDLWVLDPCAGYPVNTSSTYAERINSDTPTPKFGRKFWKKLKQRGRPPSRRSFHGACSVYPGHAVLVFGGMIDGNLMPAAAAGLGFDSELYLLQLAP